MKIINTVDNILLINQLSRKCCYVTERLDHDHMYGQRKKLLILLLMSLLR